MGMANWWNEAVVPQLIRCGCGMEAVTALRREVIPFARGRVFELGCGAGPNLPLYDRTAVTSYTAIEPTAKLLEMARAVAGQSGLATEIRPGVGEQIPFEDNAFDTVVCTFTLCTVGDPARTMAEMRRILKPGGTLLFIEHGRSPEPNIARWQERVEPVWRRLMGNCHLSRPVGPALGQAGFVVEPIGTGYQDGPRVLSWTEWGRAIKAG